MKKLFPIGILIIVLIAQSVFSQENENVVYSIEATFYNNDSGVLESISAIHASTSLFQSEKSEYNIQVLSSDGKTLFKKYIFISFAGPEIYRIPQGNESDPNLIGGPTNQTYFRARVPYYKDAAKIRFYHNEKIILDIDLSNDFCNQNSVCDPGENRINCPRDCRIISTTTQQVTTTNPSSVTLFPQTTTQEQNGAGGSAASMVLLIIVLCVIGGIAYYIYKKRASGN